MVWSWSWQAPRGTQPETRPRASKRVAGAQRVTLKGTQGLGLEAPRQTWGESGNAQPRVTNLGNTGTSGEWQAHPSSREGGSGACWSLLIQRGDKARAAVVVGAKSLNPQPYSSQREARKKGAGHSFSSAVSLGAASGAVDWRGPQPASRAQLWGQQAGGPHRRERTNTHRSHPLRSHEAADILRRVNRFIFSLEMFTPSVSLVRSTELRKWDRFPAQHTPRVHNSWGLRSQSYKTPAFTPDLCIKMPN